MPTTDWQPTDELCELCEQPKWGQLTTLPTAQSPRSSRNDWYTRCFNPECALGRLPQ